MRALTISLVVMLCTAAPSLYAQFTMAGLGTSMGIASSLQGMGSNAGAIGMGAVNGMGGYGSGMGGMGGGYGSGMGGMSGGHIPVLQNTPQTFSRRRFAPPEL